MSEENLSPEQDAGKKSEETSSKQETVKEIHHHHYRKRGWFFGLITFVLSVALFFIAVSLVIYFTSGSFPWQQIELAGETIKEERIVSDFSSIELTGSGNILIEQTGQESLLVEADKNLLEYIETEVKGDKLVIGYNNPFFWWPFRNAGEVNYYLTVDDIEKVSITGSGKVMSESLAADEFTMNVSGSGDAELGLHVSSLNSVISGSGKYTFTGEANEQEIKITGSGKYFAKDLVSRSADVTITGSGKAEVNASETLEVQVSGSGDVYYIGEPELKTNISGSGNIEKLSGSSTIQSDISGFFECLEAGNPAMESYPRKCRTEDGRTFTEDIGNEMDKIELIRLDSPRPNQTVTSPLALTGEARGTWFFEGDFPVILKDSEGNELGTGIASAKGEWMTAEFVPFTAVVKFEAGEAVRGELILEKDNPSGLSEHDNQLRVPVLFN